MTRTPIITPTIGLLSRSEFLKKAEKDKLRFLHSSKFLFFTSKTSASNHPEGVWEEGEGADEEVEAGDQESQLASNFETRFGLHCESASANFYRNESWQTFCESFCKLSERERELNCGCVLSASTGAGSDCRNHKPGPEHKLDAASGHWSVSPAAGSPSFWFLCS